MFKLLTETDCSSEQARYSKERKLGRTDSLSSIPSFTTSACHFDFSHHIPLLHVQPTSVGVETHTQSGGQRMQLSHKEPGRFLSERHMPAINAHFTTRSSHLPARCLIIIVTLSSSGTKTNSVQVLPSATFPPRCNPHCLLSNSPWRESPPC